MTAVNRLPFAPLEHEIRSSSTVFLAELLGKAPRQIYRWRTYGVTLDQADELCGRIGVHVLEVWPELLDRNEQQDLDRRRRIARESARRRYHEDPERRAVLIERARRYRQENADYMRVYRRNQRAARRAREEVDR